MDETNNEDDFEFQTATVPLADMPALIEASRERCPACGGNRVLNPHVMCRAKVEVLDGLGRFLERGEEWVRVEHGRGLQGVISKKWMKSAYRAGEHVSRARWFGLAEHRGPRSAEWRIIRNGVLFLKGEIDVPAKILCTNGVVHYESSERVFVNTVKKLELDRAYWDNYPMDDILGLV